MSGSREEYEAAVRDLRRVAQSLLDAGQNAESVARHIVDRRNAIKVAFREVMPPVILAEIVRRNLSKYGDPVGPAASALFAKYGSWDAVIRAGSRHASIQRRS